MNIIKNNISLRTGQQYDLLGSFYLLESEYN